MPDNIVDIDTYSFNKNDNLFLDANIWIYLYGPAQLYCTPKSIYSKALSRIRTFRSKIFIDVQVLSEFINRFVRMEYDSLPGDKKPETFKEFRKSHDFNGVAKEIAIQAKKIVNSATRIDSGFRTVDIDSLLKEFSTGDSDFNDQIFVELCKSEGFTFVTHDSDFGKSDMDILTGNKALLKR